MARRKRNKPTVNGFVYVLKITIDYDVYYKIGTTNRTPRHRLLEIAGELYDILGYIPKMTVMYSDQVRDNYQTESDILQSTLNYIIKPDCILYDRFNGYSEVRCMELEQLKEVYDRCVAKSYPVIQRQLIEM